MLQNLKQRILVVKPNGLDQSKSKEMKQSKSWHSDLAASSNVRRLRSCHKVHIRHKGTKFQISEDNFLIHCTNQIITPPPAQREPTQCHQKTKTPQNSCHKAVQKEMVHRLPTTSTHAPTSHSIGPVNKIITSQNFIPSR